MMHFETPYTMPDTSLCLQEQASARDLVGPFPTDLSCVPKLITFEEFQLFAEQEDFGEPM